MSERLQNIASLLLFSAIFFAPWAFGCTNQASELGLLLILGASLFCWLCSLPLRQRLPRVPFLFLVTAVFLAALGWFMTLNGHFLHDDNFMKFIPLASYWPNLPGSCEKSLSMQMMPRITILLFTMAMVMDFAREKKWRKQIFTTIALAGCSIALWGLIQRVFQAPGIFWMDWEYERAFFATYRYHANAGAYMNLALPMVAGLWISALQHEGKYFQRFFWGVGTVLMLTASLVNTSRGASMVSIFLFVSFILWQRNFFWQFFKHLPRSMLLIGGFLCAISFVSLVVATGICLSVQRWQTLPGQISTLEARLPAHQAWVHILPLSGSWGMGPGTFRAISSYFRQYGDTSITQMWWQQAHEDYLQTMIEWGYVGTFLWAVLFLGAIVCAVRYLRQKIEVTGLTNRLFLGGATLAILGVMIHATYDFPLQICSIQFYVAIFLGMMWGSSLGWLRPLKQNQS